MVSKRSLRPDPNFDHLISKIYPSREEYEANQERLLAKFNQSHSQASLVNSITVNELMKLQSQNRPQRSRKNHENDGRSGADNSGQMSSEANINRESSSGINTVDRQSSNPPSVRSTPSPAPSNNSSGTGKVKSARSAMSWERSEESESNSEEIDYNRTDGNDSNADTEGEGNSELGLNDEIELVFKPHPTEMTSDNPLMRALKENCVRYLKTTANATGNI